MKMFYISVSEQCRGQKNKQRLYFANRYPTLDEAVAYAKEYADARFNAPDFDVNDCVGVRGLKALQQAHKELEFGGIGVKVVLPDDNGESAYDIHFHILMGQLSVCELSAPSSF